jgi:hypothetical protein
VLAEKGLGLWRSTWVGDKRNDRGVINKEPKAREGNKIIQYGHGYVAN